MNNELRGKYLPVGSVVLLKNGTKRVMINGFCVIDGDQPNKIYDYSAVLFPEGNISSTQTLLFDHEQIERIDHIGLDDEEEKAFKEQLVNVMKGANPSEIAAAHENGQAPVAPTAPVAPVAPEAPTAPVAPIAPAPPDAPEATNIAPAQPVESQINPIQ